MIDGKLLVEKLVRYAKAHLGLNDLDVIYKRNELLKAFGLDSAYTGDEDISYVDNLTVPDELVAETETYGEENNLLKDGLKNLFSTYVFGILTPLPSVVNETFYKIRKEEGAQKACDYLYDLSIKNNYVQKTAISRNLFWEYKDGDNVLEITINLSKPEKDNKEIAKLLSLPKKTVKYPACALCKENEGFEGSATHPARENIRTVSLTLDGEPWFVQYSPYGYYNEHCIVINKEHTPMKITEGTVRKLIDFVDIFPNYMAGSNAALPIVGGSILNHEHYQGGGHVMPMQKAPVKKYYKSEKYKDVKIGRVKWYNSVIRLSSENKAELTALAGEIIRTWENYSCPECEILSHTGDVPHNTLSPIIRKSGDEYILDMILRNNRTNEKYPDGIFHAHPEYHNIKKEGIGLIEAMGLFILPARLKKQLDMIADILCGNAEYNEAELNKEENYLYVHRNMIKELMAEVKVNDKEAAVAAVKDKVNNICKNILNNTAVFKNDEIGENGFEDFMKAVKTEEL